MITAGVCGPHHQGPRVSITKVSSLRCARNAMYSELVTVSLNTRKTTHTLTDHDHTGDSYPEYTSTLVMVLGKYRPCDGLRDVKEILNLESHYLRINFGSIYKGRTESHEQLFFFACELGTADEGECGGRWNQLLCYP